MFEPSGAIFDVTDVLELDQVCGGNPIAVAAGLGALGGGGAALMSEMTDGRSGINWSAVFCGTIGGAGAGAAAVMGGLAGAAGGAAFGWEEPSAAFLLPSSRHWTPIWSSVAAGRCSRPRTLTSDRR